MYTHILLATDGSELSQRAEAHALGLAKLAGARVLALTVIAPQPLAYFEGSLAMAPEDLATLDLEAKQHATEVLTAVQNAGLERGVVVEPLTLHAERVGEAIVQTARSQRCDLVVMASHGRNSLQQMLLGSETQYVLSHSHLPVLVLR